MARTLTAQDLLAGASATYSVKVPSSVLRPENGNSASDVGEAVLRPLTIRDIQKITLAAKEQNVLASILMVQQALVEPALTIEQVGSMPAGLVQFLLGKVNSLSGLSVGGDEIEQAVRAPLARACFLLSHEFGWTPSQCSELTVGQVLLYLEMMARGESEGITAP